jgi:hypothetical protein
VLELWCGDYVIRAVKLRNCDRLILVTDYTLLCKVHGKTMDRIVVMDRLGITRDVEAALELDKEAGF